MQNISTPLISEKREGVRVQFMCLLYTQLPWCLLIGCSFRWEELMFTCCTTTCYVCVFFLPPLGTPTGHDTGGVAKSLVSQHLWSLRLGLWCHFNRFPPYSRDCNAPTNYSVNVYWLKIGFVWKNVIVGAGDSAVVKSCKSDCMENIALNNISLTCLVKPLCWLLH